MCTAVLLRRPGHAWPVLFAANRDEMTDRPWAPPARHWPDRPDVVAGLDHLAGGTWLGLNDDGVLAAVLNRTGSLGPQSDKRSRGELVLEALDHAEASAAAWALADLDPAAYRSFNLIVADVDAAFWLRNVDGAAGVEVVPLPAGLSVLTAHDRNDPACARTRRYLPRFQAAAEPAPAADDWRAWQGILADTSFDSADGPTAAMSIATDWGFGTTSSSLIALPAPPTSLTSERQTPRWLFAAGRPDQAGYAPIAL